MPVLRDDEFGEIVVRRSARATQVRLRVAPDGSLRASLPLYAPLFLVKRLLASSRDQLRNLQTQAQTTIYTHGMSIGKQHTLIVQPSASCHVEREGTRIIVHLPDNMTLSAPAVHRLIQQRVVDALRSEAKNYLPKRLALLASQHGFSYTQIRFSHASGRWGSCNSEGVISLNIALMKLPFELIDYVIIHELAHTVQMNHSREFWRTVEAADPDYRQHRRRLKEASPHV